MKDKIIAKITSGRYFLTIVGGVVFAYAVWQKVLPPEATASILTMIFMAYFSKERKGVDQNKN